MSNTKSLNTQQKETNTRENFKNFIAQNIKGNETAVIESESENKAVILNKTLSNTKDILTAPVFRNASNFYTISQENIMRTFYNLESDRTHKTLGIILTQNNLSGPEARQIIDKLSVNQYLTNITLNLVGIKPLVIPGEGIQRAFSLILQYNHTLKHVDFGHNKLGDEGARDIANALKSNKSVTYLSLQNNDIKWNGGVALANAIQHKNSISPLKILDLTLNELGKKGVQHLQQAAAKNHNIISIEVDKEDTKYNEVIKNLENALLQNKQFISADELREALSYKFSLPLTGIVHYPNPEKKIKTSTFNNPNLQKGKEKAIESYQNTNSNIVPKFAQTSVDKGIVPPPNPSIHTLKSSAGMPGTPKKALSASMELLRAKFGEGASGPVKTHNTYYNPPAGDQQSSFKPDPFSGLLPQFTQTTIGEGAVHLKNPSISNIPQPVGTVLTSQNALTASMESFLKEHKVITDSPNTLSKTPIHNTGYTSSSAGSKRSTFNPNQNYMDTSESSELKAQAIYKNSAIPLKQSQQIHSGSSYTGSYPTQKSNMQSTAYPSSAGGQKSPVNPNQNFIDTSGFAGFNSSVTYKNPAMPLKQSQQMYEKSTYTGSHPTQKPNMQSTSYPSSGMDQKPSFNPNLPSGTLSQSIKDQLRGEDQWLRVRPYFPGKVICVDFDKTYINTHLYSILKGWDDSRPFDIDSSRIYNFRPGKNDPSVSEYLSSIKYKQLGVECNPHLSSLLADALKDGNKVAIVTFSSFAPVIYHIVSKTICLKWPQSKPLFFSTKEHAARMEKVKVIAGFSSDAIKATYGKQEHIYYALKTCGKIKTVPTTHENLKEIFKDVALIDDDQHNIDVALKYGMNAILVNPDGTLNDHPHIVNTGQIDSTELLGHLINNEIGGTYYTE